jgi:hypothetical protein
MVERMVDMVKKKVEASAVAMAVVADEIPEMGDGGLSVQVVFRYYHPEVKECRNIKDLVGLRVVVPGSEELKKLYWLLKRVVMDEEQRWAQEARDLVMKKLEEREEREAER